MSRELPIGFKVPMVKAILEGRKSQTRRLVSGAPVGEGWHCDLRKGEPWFVADEGAPSMPAKVSINIGDRLYVREPWRTFVSLDKFQDENRPFKLLTGRKGAGILYHAGGNMSVSNGPPRSWSYGDGFDREDAYGRPRAGMHLPRWGSRLTLTVTDVRVERLKDISEADCVAEGIEPSMRTSSGQFYRNFQNPDCPLMAYGSYRSLWNHINGPDAWDANPWGGRLHLHPRTPQHR